MQCSVFRDIPFADESANDANSVSGSKTCRDFLFFILVVVASHCCHYGFIITTRYDLQFGTNWFSRVVA